MPSFMGKGPFQDYKSVQFSAPEPKVTDFPKLVKWDGLSVMAIEF